MESFNPGGAQCRLGVFLLRPTVRIRPDYEHRLNTIKRNGSNTRENPNVLHRQNRATKALSSLFAIYGQFPKLNVAGSIPVSRSMINDQQLTGSSKSTNTIQRPVSHLWL